MKPVTRYLITLGLTFLVCISLLPIYNFVVDKWRVFGDYNQVYPFKSVRALAYNENWNQVRYYLENADKYDSLVFGDSKMRDSLSLQDLNRELGGSWYKLGVSGGIVFDSLHNLKTLIHNDAAPKRILLGLGEGSLYGVRNADKHYNFRPYPHSLLQWFSALRFYLFELPDITNWHILTGELQLVSDKYRIFREIDDDPYWLAFDPADPKRTRRLYQSGPHYPNMWKRPSQVDWEVSLLKEFIELCQRHNIELTVIYTPNWYVTYYSRDLDRIEEFKRKVVRHTGFFDFTAFIPPFRDPAYWTDNLHYTPAIGREILAVIAADQVKVTAGGWGEDSLFGTYVTKKNIATHLAAIRRQGWQQLNEPAVRRRLRIVHPSHERKQ